MAVFLAAVCPAGGAHAEPAEPDHGTPTEETSTPPATAKAPPAQPGQPPQPEVRLLSTQEQLVRGLREANLPKATLDKLGTIFDNQPKATPAQFNEILERSAPNFPGGLTDRTKQRLKQLYQQQLGAPGIRRPGSEFASAAKLLSAAMPQDPPAQPPPSSAAPGIDPKGTVNQLAGATLAGAPGGDAASLQALVEKAIKANSGDLQKGLQQQLAQAQSLLQQLQQQQKNGDPKKGGLQEALAGLLKGDDKKGGEGKGDREERRGPSKGEHSPFENNSQNNNNDDKKDEDRFSRLNKSFNDRDKGQQPQQAPHQAQQSNNNNDNNNNKKEDSKKGEPIVQAGEVSKKLREEADKKREEKQNAAKNDLQSLLAKNNPADDNGDALAQAQALLANQGKGRPVRNLGKGRPGQSMGGGGKGGGGFGGGGGGMGAGGGDPGGGDFGGGGGGGGGGKGGSAATISKGGGGGGGGADGNPFQGVGEDQGGGGGPPPGMSFAKPVEFLAASNAGGSSLTEVDAGDSSGDDAPAKRKKLPQGEILVLGPLKDKRKGWLLDVVGNTKRNLCMELPDASQIGICQTIEARRQQRELHDRLRETIAPNGKASSL